MIILETRKSNKCPHCGGLLWALVTEKISTKYRLRKDGTVSRRRIGRPMINHRHDKIRFGCSRCGRTFDPIKRPDGTYYVPWDETENEETEA